MMSFIKGIGGAFIFSHRPKQLAEWYTTYLGIEFEADDAYESVYRTFLSNNQGTKDCEIVTRFFIIKAQQKFIRKLPDNEPELMYGDQPFMVNFRAERLPKLVDKLHGLGVKIIKEREEDNGHFVWIRDLDGNRVELYEPYPDKKEDAGKNKKSAKSKSNSKKKVKKKKD